MTAERESTAQNTRPPTTAHARLSGKFGWHNWKVVAFRVARWAWRRAMAFSAMPSWSQVASSMPHTESYG
jgi:hypothetical protein